MRKHTLFIIALLLSLSVLLVSTTSVHAATITVNSVFDDDDDICTVEKCTLRDAIENADSGDTIVFDPSLYAEGPASITLSSWLPIISFDLTIEGPGADLLTLDGNNEHSIMVIDGENINVSISGLTFANGFNDYDSSGGINIYGSGTVTVSDSIFSNNDGYNSYGAIYFQNSVNLIVSASTFSDNKNGYGAAIGGSGSGGSLTITGSTFTNNEGTNYGGAIYYSDYLGIGSLSITDSTFTGNSAGTGGAIYFVSGVSLEITDSTFTENVSEDSLGGAIYFRGSGDVTVTNSTFDSNSATEGSAINATSDLIIVNSTFSDNICTQSGGYGSIYFYGNDMSVSGSTFSGNTYSLGVTNVYGGAIGFEGNGDFTVSNSTFVNNNAGSGGYGGALYIYDSGGDLSINNSTFTGNVPNVFRMDDYDYVSVENSIVDTENCGDMVPTSLGHNIDSGTSCGFDHETDLNNTDPLLDPLGLQDNGGPVYTIALVANSPAIDTGDPGSCPATDARGVVRPQDGDEDSNAVCDIGAYEYNPEEFITPTPTPTNTPTSTPTPTPTGTITPSPTATPTSPPQAANTPTPDPIVHAPSCDSRVEDTEIPRIVSGSYVSPSSLTFSFVPVIGVEGYTLLYGVKSADEYSARYENTDSSGLLSYTIHDLFPSDTWKVKIQAYRGCTSGPYSSEYTIRRDTNTNDNDNSNTNGNDNDNSNTNDTSTPISPTPQERRGDTGEKTEVGAKTPSVPTPLPPIPPSSEPWYMRVWRWVQGVFSR